LQAVILSAGQGKRLLPHTAELPKCLLKIGGRTVLERQLAALHEAGVQRATIVVGFGAKLVEDEVASRTPHGMDVRTIHNELYDRSDNLVSCLAARGAMAEDFLLVNGDTLFQPEIVRRLLASTPAPIAMAIASKPAYDDDDMKVHARGGRVWRIGKDLPPDESNGEAIGVCLMRGDGPPLFVTSLEKIEAEPDGHRRWYLSAINVLAGLGHVEMVPVGSLGWIEIDFPQDLEKAQATVPAWPAPAVVDDQPRMTGTNGADLAF
jgi:choline kinase